jgi:protein O-mannosyl-transferase
VSGARKRRREATKAAALGAAPVTATAPATDRSRSAGLPWWRRPPVVAAAVAFLVYLPSLGGGFLYDDGALIERNPSIRDLGAIATILRYEPARPLLNLTWALNYAAAGLDPWPYHLVNVLLHAGNAALLAMLFLWMARRIGWPDPQGSALLGACLFAATPMAAETVAYVASRSTALSALFALASLRIAAGVLEGGPRRRSRLVVAVFIFLLALATKEEAAALPLLLLLVDYFFVAAQKLADMKTRWWIHAPFVLLVPLGLAARRIATGAWLPPPAMSPGLYLLTQAAAFPFYFLRAVVPFDPAFYRYQLPARWPPDAFTVAAVLLGVALLVLILRHRREQPAWAFAVLALAIGLLPSSSIVALREMVVDHRAYLGSLGVAFALGGLVWRLGGMRAGAVVVALFAARSLHYEWVLADPVRAWEDAVRRAPASADAICALGEAYKARDDPRAEAAFLQATRLNPRNFRYWANLGVYYAERSRLDEAAAALRSAVREAPGDAAVHDYLGTVLQRQRHDDEAAREFEAAIAAEPDFAPAHINLAALLIRKGEPERARALLETASRLPIEPQDAERIVSLQQKLR